MAGSRPDERSGRRTEGRSGVPGQTPVVAAEPERIPQVLVLAQRCCAWRGAATIVTERDPGLGNERRLRVKAGNVTMHACQNQTWPPAGCNSNPARSVSYSRPVWPERDRQERRAARQRVGLQRQRRMSASEKAQP